MGNLNEVNEAVPEMPEKSNKKIFLVFGIAIFALILIIIVAVFFILFSGEKIKITEAELNAGKTLGVNENARVYFEIGDKKYSVQIEEILSNVKIKSGNESFTLAEGEEEYFDWDGDAEPELKMTLNSVDSSNKKANFLFKKTAGFDSVVNSSNNSALNSTPNSTPNSTTNNSNNNSNGNLNATDCVDDDGVCDLGCEIGDMDCTCAEQGGTDCDRESKICGDLPIFSSDIVECCLVDCVEF